MTATALVGSWAVLRAGAALICFATREEAAAHAAQLSARLDGEELIVAWIAGIYALKHEPASLASERKRAQSSAAHPIHTRGPA